MSPTSVQASFPPHTPPVHSSVLVHALPSSQAVPLALLAKLQVPSPLQVPAWWHWSGAAQVKAVPPQVPAVQTSFLVQAVPSSHAVPSAAAGFEHMPLVGSHVPATWH